jgi:hypothetical protein
MEAVRSEPYGSGTHIVALIVRALSAKGDAADASQFDIAAGCRRACLRVNTQKVDCKINPRPPPSAQMEAQSQQ